MSTRSQIWVFENGYLLNLYHHHDGYFSGVGRELQSILKQHDDGIKAGWFGAGDFCMELFKNYEGYECVFEDHDDIEYFYILNFDKKNFVGYPVSSFSGWGMDNDEEGDGKRRPPKKAEHGKCIDLMTYDIKDDE